MSISRYTGHFRRSYLGQGSRTLRGLTSRRLRESYGDNDSVFLLGPAGHDGTRKPVHADQFGTPGIIARPAESSAIESACIFVGGASDHAVEVAALDHGRVLVVAKVGREADETIVYTQSAAIKIDKNGDVLIGRLDGDWTGFDSVVTRSEFLAHTHRPPTLTGQASYVEGTDPSSATSTPVQDAGHTVLQTQVVT